MLYSYMYNAHDLLYANKIVEHESKHVATHLTGSQENVNKLLEFKCCSSHLFSQ